jgi:K+-transporting ATPase c subunit
LSGTPATRRRTLSAIVGGGKPIGSDSSGSCGRSRSISKGVRRPLARTVYDPTSTGGTNLAPTSKKLIDATRATVAALKKANSDVTGPIW